jgi:hypothetical protein
MTSARLALLEPPEFLDNRTSRTLDGPSQIWKAVQFFLRAATALNTNHGIPWPHPGDHMHHLFRRISRAVAIVALLLPLLSVAGSNAASADTMTWQLRSYSPNAVEVKFFSQNRRVTWPSATTHYDIKDYKVHSFKLSCLAGEKICYGAGVSGNLRRYWGMSTDGKQRCTNCCFTCNGDTTTNVQNLNDK